MKTAFSRDFRRFFVRGLAAVLPTLLTVMIIVYVLRFVQERIGVHINSAIIYLVGLGLPHVSVDDIRKAWDERWYLQGVGFILAVVFVYVVGRFVASFIGRSVWQVVEQALQRAPVVRLIYPSVKQVTDFLFTQQQETGFSRVVAVEYPRKGIWSIGFVTGRGMQTLGRTLGADLLTVFVPSSPTPVTGYVITVRRDEAIDMPLSIDEVFRFAISCGVVMPPGQALSEGDVPPEPSRTGPVGRGDMALPAAGKHQEIGL